MLDRLASHKAASSLSSGPALYVGTRGPRGWMHPTAARAQQPAQSRCSTLVDRQGVTPMFQGARERLLEPVDYKDMYGTRPPSSITNELLWSRLEPLLWYLPNGAERQQVRDALELAALAHSGQMRKSGEPFITHPVEVTRILAEMRADSESLIAGLLHDTVEDTECVSFDDIEARFGASVRRIVEGETKISKITRASPDADDKAKDLQGLFMAMTEDVRIILVKLADRLHNMRTLYGMKEEKQIKISQETLQVFAPLAKLLGVYCIKEELEDLSLRYMQPQVYHHIKSWQEKQMSQYQKAFAAGKHDLEALLASDPYLQWHAQGWAVRVRQKPVYSIYKQLLALQATKERADATVRQETVAAGSAAAAAEDLASGKRSGRGSGSWGLAAGGPAPPGTGPMTSPAKAAAAAVAAAAPGSSSGLGDGLRVPRGSKAQQQAAIGLLTHLKELPDQGVFLQVIVDELEAVPAGPNYQMESHQLCYYVLGLVHSIWSPIPGALQDFIGSPKTNGYQSLHTRVVPLSILSKNCPLLPMEVQIRTQKMDKLADLGVAATNWGVNANHMRRLGAMPSSSSRVDPAGPILEPPVFSGGNGNGNGALRKASYSSTGYLQARGYLPLGPVLPAAAAAGEDGSSSSSSVKGGSSNQGSRNGRVAGGVKDGRTNGRTFWMNLASFMLESMAAGGSSLAAITGAFAIGASSSSSGSPPDDGEAAGGLGRPADSWLPGLGQQQQPQPGYGQPGNGRSSSTNGNGNGNGKSSGSRADVYLPMPVNGNGWVQGPGGWNTSTSNNGNGSSSSSGAVSSSSGAPGSPFMPTFMPREQLDGNWLTQMRKWQEEFVGSLSAREFVDGVTAEVLGQSVFVYTHTGELRRLPKGSTVVDFAYSVHTQLGNEMRAALVNGRLVAPSYVLSNGEVVEVKRETNGITPSTVRRHEQWVGLVHTRSAKLKIKQFVKEHAHLGAKPGRELSSSGEAAAKQAVVDKDMWLLEEIQDRSSDVVKTLSISCKDKMGLLAVVCAIISDSGHNIKSVSGLPVDSGEYNMTFVIKGADAVLPHMLEQILQVDGVESYAVSCERGLPGSAP